jgi:hypothetical protein
VSQATADPTTPFIEETGADVRLHSAETLLIAGIRLTVDGAWVEVA